MEIAAICRAFRRWTARNRPSQFSGRWFFIATLLFCHNGSAEPLLQPGDVVALLGGEDMVAAAESGHIEARCLLGLQGSRVKFRSLAWEGDTVFQQFRDRNYPTLAQHLDEIGATLVILQFGKMESIEGDANLVEFVAAYERLLERLTKPDARRLVLQAPSRVAVASLAHPRFHSLERYVEAVRDLAHRRRIHFVDASSGLEANRANFRDGVHLGENGLVAEASQFATHLVGKSAVPATTGALIELIKRKNELWFHYARPENWAFLHGELTFHPASRDHRSGDHRWFPEEMKDWLPLIESAESEIWRLARARP
jgi:hypothetical protein